MLIQKVEAFLGRHIEGFFNKNFSTEIKPAELAKALYKEAFLKKETSAGETFIPNQYTYFFSKEDFSNILPRQNILRQKMMHALLCYLIHKNFFMKGELKIQFRSATHIREGQFILEGCFAEIPLDRFMESVETSEETKVFQRNVWELPEQLPDLAYAKLTVVMGSDQGFTNTFGTERIHIGRRECNEVPLKDHSASRLHAYIAMEAYRHVLYDAGSLNGTYVNEKKITRQCLQSGDRIQVGNSTILYEVNALAF